MADKLYSVEKISFYDFTVIAAETDKTISDVPAEEVFDISDFREFHVTLNNWHGEVIDFQDYVKNRKSQVSEPLQIGTSRGRFWSFVVSG